MTDEEILKEAQEAEPAKSPKWARARAIWDVLKLKGFQPKEASEWIAEKHGLPKEEQVKLRNQISRWKGIEKGNQIKSK